MLHTLSIDFHHVVDFTLMGRLTTLIMDFAEADDWTLIQQHCRSLEHLHVIVMYVNVHDMSAMIAAVSEMPSLHALYFAAVPPRHKSACTEAANELRVLRPSLHIEENEADWTWYDLFKLPI